MSLPKETVRTEVPAEVHKALCALQERSKFRTIARYVEWLICRHVVSESRNAILLADQLQRAGIDRNWPDSQFSDGVRVD